ncbi:hypothetical protein [Pseudanabaena sp. UWO310]|uniref:hypothetical protein n=1 Tax=Pseudanabaena sp. UWO310 TaxID=2480795 RepID=UPI0011609CC0|nr:hypothetical protein [Pseudanabaena sp. UWO310]TYQ24717.1 hypothetical protein PseudUWO310_20355 [Pseudanabaena sp. UWO310]
MEQDDYSLEDFDPKGDSCSAESQITAIIDQTNRKENFEIVALQRFQNFPWFGFERNALYVYRAIAKARSR